MTALGQMVLTWSLTPRQSAASWAVGWLTPRAAGAAFRCDSQPGYHTDEWLLCVPQASSGCGWVQRGGVPQTRAPSEPSRNFQGFLQPAYTRPSKSLLLPKASLLHVRERGLHTEHASDSSCAFGNLGTNQESRPVTSYLQVAK